MDRKAFARAVAAGVAVFALVASALLVADRPATGQQRKAPPPSRDVAQFSFAPIVKIAAPGVVNIFVRSRPQYAASAITDDPVLRRFLGEKFGMPEGRLQNSLGSGVIVAPEGIVVTNTHVIKGGGSPEIRVVLADRREYDARVIAQDDKTDIAVLRIEGGDGRFPFLEVADSDAVEVGDLVLAIGNPFGVGQTVTSGIVSALARSEIGNSDAQVFIQTDAAINPGNSGGALVDMNGRVIGINTAIFSKSGGSVGIGFAIPSNLVRLYVEGAISGRKVERPWLGARLDAVNREIADALGLQRPFGAVVTRVVPGGPAAEAGLKTGDVIVGVDGFEAADPRTVTYRLTTRGVGNRSRLDMLRQGKPLVAEVALRTPPKPQRDDVRNLAGNHPLDGARVSNILPGVTDDLGLEDDAGVAITAVRANSVASGLGFKAGDVILQVGRDKVATVIELERVVATRQRMWQIAVKRGGRVLQLQVPG
jgi:Do/DeqQ family serine protease